MAHMMRKVEFMALVSKFETVYFRTFRGSVYVRNGQANTESEVEVYRASNIQESGIISSMNQSAKYQAWAKIEMAARNAL